MKKAIAKMKEMARKGNFCLVATIVGALVGAGLASLAAWLIGVDYVWLLAIMAAGEILGAILTFRFSWRIQENLDEETA